MHLSYHKLDILKDQSFILSFGNHMSEARLCAKTQGKHPPLLLPSFQFIQVMPGIVGFVEVPTAASSSAVTCYSDIVPVCVCLSVSAFLSYKDVRLWPCQFLKRYLSQRSVSQVIVKYEFEETQHYQQVVGLIVDTEGQIWDILSQDRPSIAGYSAQVNHCINILPLLFLSFILNFYNFKQGNGIFKWYE